MSVLWITAIALIACGGTAIYCVRCRGGRRIALLTACVLLLLVLVAGPRRSAAGAGTGEPLPGETLSGAGGEQGAARRDYRAAQTMWERRGLG